MKTLGPARHERPTRRAELRQEPRQYTIELDVSEFAQAELEVVLVGHEVTVRCNHNRDGGSMPLSLHERLEESFRLPDDADVQRLRAVFRDGTLTLSARRRPLARQAVPVESDYLVDSTPNGC